MHAHPLPHTTCQPAACNDGKWVVPHLRRKHSTDTFEHRKVKEVSAPHRHKTSEASRPPHQCVRMYPTKSRLNVAVVPLKMLLKPPSLYSVFATFHTPPPYFSVPGAPLVDICSRHFMRSPGPMMVCAQHPQHSAQVSDKCIGGTRETAWIRTVVGNAAMEPARPYEASERSPPGATPWKCRM